ncbi:FG-GAP repeat protein [Stella humosa]|uniref:FG-GAP repeat protein n=1 Tax=Stella humosa TaxID=94 RepID=A0A3N1M0N0_9PROT|nr:Ig-like domain-containing protein [Stella humosa]ROQ01044.1 FG-GAP repeat protein [Stella humosa]BBK31414.1 hypothetical protein STHU_20480 [Stella humosa]
MASAFSTVELSSLGGGKGFTLNGVAGEDGSGFSVHGAGDVNGDGIDDIVVGARKASPDRLNAGVSYVVFGTTAGFSPSFELSSLDGGNGFAIHGASIGDYLGFSVSAAGDINGDGIDDVIIGAPYATPHASYSGAAYVVFGATGGFAAVLQASSIGVGNGFQIHADDVPNEANYWKAGRSVSGAGDVNGDGIDDVIVGQPYLGSGASYVVFGSTAGFGTVELSALDGGNGFAIDGEQNGDESGRAVSAAGDVNGDGIDDLVIGAPAVGFPYDTGASYVVFGTTAGFAPSMNLASLDGSNGFAINAVADRFRNGRSVAGAGDVNGDGVDDLIVGDSDGNVYGGDPGASYVVFGNTAGFAASLDLSSLDGNNGFRINGASAGDLSGTAVAAAGDFNGDGIDDLIVGAFAADPNGDRSGGSYVVFGATAGFGASLELSALATTAGFRINGASAGDEGGWSVASAGDVNGDGFDDLIVGAPGVYSNGERAGATYVIFGGVADTNPPPPPPGSSNRPPDAEDDAFSVPWQGKLLVQGPGLLGNDTDADGNPLTVTGIVAGPAHGVLTWNPDGGFIYQPNATYVGPDAFTYQVGDGRGGFDTASVSITVADDEKPDPIWPIDGGFGNDRLAGSNQADTIRGNGGDDTITGDGGRDRLEGNTGNDSILGQGDEDIAWGGQGNDMVNGNQANDWVLGDRGADTVHGGAGHDFVWGGQGDDRVFGDGSHDMLSGDRGNDTLTGGQGADRFVIKEAAGYDLVADFASAEGDRIVIDTGGDGILNGLSIGSFADLLARMVDTPDGVFLSLGDPDHGVTIAGIRRDQLTAGDFLLL